MGISLSRRSLLAALGLAPAACANLPRGVALSSARAPAPFPFEHGVASGDPRQDRVILWTRLGQIGTDQDIPVTWEVSADPGFATLQDSGETFARARDDRTVKVDVGGLSPGEAQGRGRRRGIWRSIRWSRPITVCSNRHGSA